MIKTHMAFATIGWGGVGLGMILATMFSSSLDPVPPWALYSIGAVLLVHGWVGAIAVARPYNEFQVKK